MKLKRYSALALIMVLALSVLPLGAAANGSSSVGNGDNLPALNLSWVGGDDCSVLLQHAVPGDTFYEVSVAGNVSSITFTLSGLTAASVANSDKGVAEASEYVSGSSYTVNITNSALPNNSQIGGTAGQVALTDGNDTYRVRIQSTGAIKVARNNAHGEVYFDDITDVMANSWSSDLNYYLSNYGGGGNYFGKTMYFNRTGQGKNDGRIRIAPVPDDGYAVSSVTVNGIKVDPDGQAEKDGIAYNYYLVGSGSANNIDSKLYNVAVTFIESDIALGGGTGLKINGVVKGGGNDAFIDQIAEELEENFGGKSIGDILGALLLTIDDASSQDIAAIAAALVGEQTGGLSEEQIITKIKNKLGYSGDDYHMQALDITLTYDDNYGTTGEIHDLGSCYIEVTFDIPPHLKELFDNGGYTFAMLVFHIDGSGNLSVEVVNCVNNGNGTLTARLKKFSTYGLFLVPATSSNNNSSYWQNSVANTPQLYPESNPYNGYGSLWFSSSGFYNNFRSFSANGVTLTEGVDYEVINRSGFAQFVVYESALRGLSGNVPFRAVFSSGTGSCTVQVVSIPNEVTIAAPKTGGEYSALGFILVAIMSLAIIAVRKVRA